MPETWEDNQSNYWDSVAERYDGFYANKWSYLEDKLTLANLNNSVELIDCKSVLDIACGTGLGYKLVTGINKDIDYSGIDISKGMVEVFEQKYGRELAYVGSMTNLSQFEDNSFDIVMALNTSFSYCRYPSKALDEVYRVLKPQGVIFLSVLGKNSLRRLLKQDFQEVEYFQTRGDNTELSVPAITYTKSKLIELVSFHGFSNIKIRGQSFFGGVCEQEYIWRLDCFLAKHLKVLCHNIIVSGKKE